ncbi:MAG: sortase [Chloroflexi bacterium]|nr:sortase [Chloroflexota bacterium]
MHPQRLSIYPHLPSVILLALSLLLLAACQVPTPVPVVLAPATATPSTAKASSATSATSPAMQATAPVKLAIPALNLEMPIVPMGWEVVEANGQRTTKWIVPKDAIGWHANSAGAGTNGNTILSGHQAQGEALFAPLATGEIVVGQEIILTDAQGATFTYRVTEVTEPIALTGASQAEMDQAASYIAPSTTPKLTLITGWPDFTTTHRIFAVADLVQ